MGSVLFGCFWTLSALVQGSDSCLCSTLGACVSQVWGMLIPDTLSTCSEAASYYLFLTYFSLTLWCQQLKLLFPIIKIHENLKKVCITYFYTFQCWTMSPIQQYCSAAFCIMSVPSFRNIVNQGSTFCYLESNPYFTIILSMGKICSELWGNNSQVENWCPAMLLIVCFVWELETVVGMLKEAAIECLGRLGDFLIQLSNEII